MNEASRFKPVVPRSYTPGMRPITTLFVAEMALPLGVRAFAAVYVIRRKVPLLTAFPVVRATLKLSPSYGRKVSKMVLFWFSSCVWCLAPVMAEVVFW